MAEIIGYIGTALERVESRSKPGRFYYSFRLAENSGTGDNRKTTWYDVRAVISEAKAAELFKGLAVRVQGRLDPQPYVRPSVLKDAKVPRSWNAIVQVLKARQALDSSIVVITSSVQPHEFPQRQEEDRQAAA